MVNILRVVMDIYDTFLPPGLLAHFTITALIDLGVVNDKRCFWKCI